MKDLKQIYVLESALNLPQPLSPELPETTSKHTRPWKLRGEFLSGLGRSSVITLMSIFVWNPPEGPSLNFQEPPVRFYVNGSQGTLDFLIDAWPYKN